MLYWYYHENFALLEAISDANLAIKKHNFTFNWTLRLTNSEVFQNVGLNQQTRCKNEDGEKEIYFHD